MTIQIDDAGWGCLLGGVLVGAYRTETQAFAWGEIPVAHFQGRAFADRTYLHWAVEVARGLFGRLSVERDEPVQVCSGYVLEGVRQWLDAGGYTWRTAKVDGSLQLLVETALLERLHSLGLRDLDLETLTKKQGLLFWKCLRWLKGGDAEAPAPVRAREQFAKTGWRTYPIWANNPYRHAKHVLRKTDGTPAGTRGRQAHEVRLRHVG